MADPKDIDDLSKRMASLEVSINKAASSTEKFDKADGKATEAVLSLRNSIVSLNSNVDVLKTKLDGIVGQSFSGFNNILIAQNKNLFELSRQSSITGQGLISLQSGIRNLSNSTSFSIIESTKFYKAMSDGTKGLKLTNSAIKDLGQALTTEFGPALQDCAEAMNTLMSVQEKDISVLDRLRAGMSTNEIVAYVSAMEGLGKMTSKQANDIIRLNSAMGKNGEQLSGQEQKLQEAAIAQQKLNKIWDDVKLDWVNKLNEFLPKINNMLGSIVDKFKSIPAGLLKAGLLGGIGVGTLGVGAGVYAGISKAKDFLGFAPGGKDSIFKGSSVTVPGKAGGVPSLTGGGLGDFLGTKPIPVYIVGQNVGLYDGLGKKTGSLIEAEKATAEEVKKLPSKFSQWNAMPGSPLGKIGTAGVLAAGGYAAGYLGDTASDYFKSKGDKKSAAGAKTIGGVAEFTAYGAAIGTILPVIGTTVGALAGAGVGLYQNFDNLSVSLSTAIPFFGSYVSAQQSAADEVTRLAEALGEGADIVPGWWTKVSAFFSDLAGYGNGANLLKDDVQGQQLAKRVNNKYGGMRKWEEMNSTEKELIRNEALYTGGVAKKYGIAKDDEDKIHAADLKERMVKGAFSGSGKTDAELDKITKSFIAGTISKTSVEYEKISNYGKDSRNFQKIAGESAMATGRTGANAAATERAQQEELNGTNVLKLRYDSLNEKIKLRLDLSNQIIASNQKAIDLAFRTLAPDSTRLSLIDKSMAENNEMINALKVQLELKDKMNSLESSGKSDAEMQEILVSLAMEQGASRKEALQMVNLQKIKEADRSKIQGDINEKISAGYDIENRRFELKKSEKDILDAQMGVLESEMELTRSMYLGLGPTLDKQQELVDMAEKRISLLEVEIQELLRAQAVRALTTDQQVLLANKQREKNSLVQKELDITKNLREGYLDAMMAFTNVSGAFGKIILKKEMGIGEMLRNFGGPGGQKVGALGAGSNNSMMGWQKDADGNASLRISSDKEYNGQFNKYVKPEDMLRDRTKSSVAAAINSLGEQGAAANLQLGSTPLNIKENAKKSKAEEKISEDDTISKENNKNSQNKNTDLVGGLSNKEATTKDAMANSVTLGINNSELSKFILSGRAVPSGVRDINTNTPNNVNTVSEKRIDALNTEINKLQETKATGGLSTEQEALLAQKQTEKNSLTKNQLGSDEEDNKEIKKLQGEISKEYSKYVKLTSFVPEKPKGFIEAIWNEQQENTASPEQLAIFAKQAAEKKKIIDEKNAQIAALKDKISLRAISVHDISSKKETKSNEKIEEDDKKQEELSSSVDTPSIEEKNQKDAETRGKIRDKSIVARQKEWTAYFKRTSGENSSSRVTVGIHGRGVHSSKKRENERRMQENLDRASRDRVSQIEEKKKYMEVLDQKIESGTATEWETKRRGSLESEIGSLEFQEKRASKYSYGGNANRNIRNGYIGGGDRGSIQTLSKNDIRMKELQDSANKGRSTSEEREEYKTLFMAKAKENLERSAIKYNPNWSKNLFTGSTESYKKSKAEIDSENLIKWQEKDKKWKEKVRFQEEKHTRLGNAEYAASQVTKDNPNATQKDYDDAYNNYINTNPLHDSSGKKLTEDQSKKLGKKYNEEDIAQLKNINENSKNTSKILIEQTGIHKDVASNVEAESKVIVENSKKNASSLTSFDSGAAAMLGGGKVSSGSMSFGNDSFSDYNSMAEAMFGFGGFDGGFKFAEGGKVPGTGNEDTVPAMLTPGELVLTKEQASRWEMMNESLNRNRFAVGGYVNGIASSGKSLGSSSGGGMPNISINVKGDTVNKIMKSVTTQLSTVVNHMMTPSGTTSRLFDRGRS